MNLIDVTRELATDDQCYEFLEHMRWPDGTPRCPTCGNDKLSRINRKVTATSKNKRARLFQCLEKTCKKQFSVTSGTIFNDSHLPLQKWFMAITLVMDAKKGISAKQLQEHLGLGSYQTAWHMTHRIREAMQDTLDTKLSGIVEVDETYIGGKSRTIGGRVRNQKPRNEKFDMVIAMRERSVKGRAKDGKYGKTGRVKFVHIPDGTKASIKAAVEAYVDPFVDRLYTDSAAVYDFALDETLRKKHRAVNHTIQWVVPGSRIHTNTVESSFSLLKRGLIGSFHRVSIKHLSRYLGEFEYRFNLRKSVERFEGTVRRMCAGSPLTYDRLTFEPEA
jgi:transposase-like protein